MGAPGTKHEAVLEPVDVHVQAVREHAHASNEEVVLNLKQEEGRISIGAQPVGMLFAKCFYLALR